MKLLASGAACVGLATLLVAVPPGAGPALAATVTLNTGITGTLDCAGAPPVVNTAARTATLASDCTVKGSVTVQDGYTFRGAGHTLTADYGDVEPRTGQTTEMFPAVLVDGGTANIANMTIRAVNTTGFNVLSPWGHSMEGVLYQDSSGTMDSVTVQNFGVAPPSVLAKFQGGSAIIVSAHGGARRSVSILHSVVTGYQKTGIGFFGNVDGTVMHSTIGQDIATITDPADTDVIGANGIVVSRDTSPNSGGDLTGASAQIRDNTFDLSNDYLVPGAEQASTGVLISRSEGAVDIVHNAFDYTGADTEVSVYDLGAAGNSEVIILGNKFSGITPTEDTEPAILYMNPSSADTETYVGYNLYAVTTAKVAGIASLLGPGAPGADTSGGAPPGVPGKKLPVSTKIPESGISVVSHGTTLQVSWPAVSPLYYVPVAGYCVFVDDLPRQCAPDAVAMDYRIPAAFAAGSTHTVTVWPFVGKNSQAIYKSSNEFAVDWTRVAFAIPLPEPAIRLVKSATPATYATAGQVIRYTFLVINDGDADLAHVRVTDTLAGLSAISCPDSTLPAGSSETCTATYRITAADLTAGHVTNQARAEASAEPARAVMSAVSTATIHAIPTVPVLPPVPVTG